MQSPGSAHNAAVKCLTIAFTHVVLAFSTTPVEITSLGKATPCPGTLECTVEPKVRLYVLPGVDIIHILSSDIQSAV